MSLSGVNGLQPWPTVAHSLYLKPKSGTAPTPRMLIYSMAYRAVAYTALGLALPDSCAKIFLHNHFPAQPFVAVIDRERCGALDEDIKEMPETKNGRKITVIPGAAFLRIISLAETEKKSITKSHRAP